MRHRAKMQIMLADSVKEPQRYKTLYYGLKRNHPHNVAVIHPLMFLTRRIIYALVIVFMDQVPFWGVIIFMYMTLIMLAYALSEQQWKARIINQQHWFNESTLYLLSVLMLCFSDFLSPLMRYGLGFVLITIVFIFVIYNVIIMLLCSCNFFILIIRKQYYKRKRRILRKEVKQIVNQV